MIRVISREISELLPQKRSPGIHVSDVIRKICVDQGLLKDYPEDQASKYRCRWELGLALEWAIIERYNKTDPGRFIRPEETLFDGILVTPDVLDTADWVIEEIKLTWMSSHGFDVEGDKCWKFWAQVMAYCYAFNCMAGRLHVCFVNGDYRSGTSEWMTYQREFTESELLLNWMTLKTAAEEMENV